jgi:uncharacterized protein YbjT (DUF2867 family)
MPGSSPILVTGATGTVGREVTTQLIAAGWSVRALARDPGAARLPTGAEPVKGDLGDPASLAGPLEGVDAVFLLWPFTSEKAAQETATAVVTTMASSVERIVYLSADAARADPGSFWARVEQAVERADVARTVLRPTGFAKNTFVWASQIRAGDVVRWPYGAAVRSLIDERDIAAVAVRALTETSHDRASYTLTGLEQLTQVQQVQAIGDALGRPLRWEEASPEEVRPQVVDALGDERFADRALQTWARFVDEPEPVTDTVEDVTGWPPRTLRAWAARHAADFR